MNQNLEFATNLKRNPSSFHGLRRQDHFNGSSNDGCEYGSSSTHGSHKKIPIFDGFSHNSSPIPYSCYDPFQNYWNNGIPKASNPSDLDISNIITKNPQTTTELPKSPQRQVKRDTPGNTKGRWTPQEDSNLIRLVKQNGKKKWASIASMLGGRRGKQCRERWENYLDPRLKKDKWSEDEENNLIAAHKIVGTRWAELARMLPGRSESCIKNLWNVIKRRMTTQNGNGNNNSRRLSPFESYIHFLIQYPLDEVEQWINPNPEPEFLDHIKSSTSTTLLNSGSDYEVVEEEEEDVFKVDAYYPVFPNENASFLNEEFDEQKEMDFLEMLIHSF